MKGKIIVCGSQKGGVGKTVTTFNLAYELTALGKKVLAVDFDSQGNLSTVCRAWHTSCWCKSSHGYLPPSVANHKSVSVMVWMKEVV